MAFLVFGGFPGFEAVLVFIFSFGPVFPPQVGERFVVSVSGSGSALTHVCVPCWRPASSTSCLRRGSLCFPLVIHDLLQVPERSCAVGAHG